MTETKEQITETQEQETPADELSQLRDKVAQLSDKYLRAMAELENSRRRAGLDAESVARSRAMSVAENFLPLVDAIGAALAHSPADKGLAALAAAADGALAKTGIVRIEAAGQKLNPQFHNAVSVAENAGAESGVITEELQPGYMFGDTVLRPAMVVVAK